jgi:hypothetical protein
VPSAVSANASKPPLNTQRAATTAASFVTSQSYANPLPRLLQQNRHKADEVRKGTASGPERVLTLGAQPVKLIGNIR